ncbi:EF-hand domain-containing protein [Zhongshania guokunii]|uniref:EF-hand domain-containing protein n=1 Tax=Zhongshania guokunii TaxID=641783 RepID=A0ABV3U707_9GAMM
MKKIATVFAGLALSSFCLAEPMSGAIQGSGTGSGGVNTDIQQGSQQGSGGLNLQGQGSQGQGALQGQGSMQGSDDASNAIFTALDQNGDGALDEKEAQSEQSLRQYFSAIDSDANGAVSRDEYMDRQDAIQKLEEEAE